MNDRREYLMKLIESLDKKKSLQLSKKETLIYLFYSIQYNKNINPNDITIDLNDDRISQLQIDDKENNNMTSSIISAQKKQNTIRFSEILSEKISMRMSKGGDEPFVKRDSKFPYDTEIEEAKENSDNYNNININEINNQKTEVEYNDGNDIYEKEKKEGDDANINNNNENNFDDNEIMNNDIKYIIKDENNSNYQMETSNNNINNENFSDINYQNNIITTNYNDDEYIYKGNNYPEKDKNNEYNNIQNEKIDSSQ